MSGHPIIAVIDEPPMVRITGQNLPDRDTIGGSRADRDYRMARHINASLWYGQRSISA
jgi:hypothetical protein